MSAGSHSFSKPPRSPGLPSLDIPSDVLGELLHSLSQPLTGLRCSLELSLELSLDPSLGLSLEEAAEQKNESVAAALQETEKVIGMVQLMREYLDAEQSEPAPFSSTMSCALELVTRSVVEELSSIAAVRDVHLRLVGSCTATVPVPEARLRLAVQYLVSAVIEAQPPGGRVLAALAEDRAETILRVEEDCFSREPQGCNLGFRKLAQSTTGQHELPGVTWVSASASTSVLTLRRARLAIARRVLETAGASLVFAGGDAPVGFVLRIPRRG